ncbi:hypothetical protein L218DRAFT_811055, partial [Marasmius fiardii PR-910]
GRLLHLARVDPHPTFGCEVVLVINPSMLGKLEQIQNKVVRRLLCLHSRSP